jgi:predicted signal transduction protein with EAL and GGDEF domain
VEINTVSIGCAAWEPEHDADVASVIRSADEALYKANTTRRNKVVLFTKSPTQRAADFRDTTENHSHSLI